MSDSVQDETGQAPAQEPEAAGTPDTEPDATAPAPEGADPGEPDELAETKRKFREALDRKKQASGAGSADSGSRGTGKAHGAGSPATSRRQFRRKSG
jgi:hypothetical protein